jgi:biotin operon repressor
MVESRVFPSHAQKSVMAAIAWACNDSLSPADPNFEWAWLSRSALADKVGLSRSTVIENCRKLVDAGLLVEEPSSGGSRFSTVRYAIREAVLEALDMTPTAQMAADRRAHPARPGAGPVREPDPYPSGSRTPTRPGAGPDIKGKQIGNKNLAREADADFALWWMDYPRKEGRKAALKAYQAAIRSGVTAETLRSSLARRVAFWRREKTEARFIPLPATWLNQGRWDDFIPEGPKAAPELDASAPAPFPIQRHGVCDECGRAGHRHATTCSKFIKPRPVDGGIEF